MGRALGEFEIMMLFAVLRLSEEAYGAAVVREIEERTGREVSQGAVYTGLDRLEARGLLASSVETNPTGGGRPRRFYRLSEAGRLSLSRSMEAIERIAEGLRSELPAPSGGGESP